MDLAVDGTPVSQLRVAHLKRLLTARGLSSHGLKPELAARLAAAMDQPTAPSPAWLVAGAAARRFVPCPRAGHSLVAHSGRVYLFGGFCDYASYVAAFPAEAGQVLRGARPGIGRHFGTLHEFSYDEGEWRLLHNGEGEAPRARRHASCVVHGGSLFVYGGFDVDDSVLSDLWEFRIEQRVWEKVKASVRAAHNSNLYLLGEGTGSSMPVARAEHTAIVHCNRMVIFGGYDGKKKLNDTYVYDFALRKWSQPPNAKHNPPSRRCKHSAVLYDKKMYVLGGFQYNNGDNYALTDLHALDLETFVWSSIIMSTGNPEALQGHKAVVCGDSMYVLGGKVRGGGGRSASASTTLAASSGNVVVHHAPAAIAAASGGNMNAPVAMFGSGNAAVAAAVAPQAGTNGAVTGAPSSSALGFGVAHSALQSALHAVHAASNLSAHAGPALIPSQERSSGLNQHSSGLNQHVFRYRFDANKWCVLQTSGQKPMPRQLHAAVALPSGGGRSSIFVFGGTDKAKQRYFDDLCELRGIRSTTQSNITPCGNCASTRTLLNNEMFSDVRFLVEGRVVYAHRCILYSRAEYFRHMFDSNMREQSQSEIEIPDVSYAVFSAVMEFLYSGRVKVDEGHLALDLLKAADMFRLDRLRSLCVEKVEQAVTVDNAAFICQVADTHNAQHLKLYCITFIMQNFKEVICSESFQGLMRQDPGGLGREILEAYSDNSPYSSGNKRPRK